MILLDTSFLVALFRENDEKHERAAELVKEIKGRVTITDHIFSELITFLTAKDGNSTAYGAGKKINESEIILISVLREDIPIALNYIRKYQGISMCDALSVVVMKNMGIRKIASFDSDFDKFSVERIF